MNKKHFKQLQLSKGRSYFKSGLYKSVKSTERKLNCASGQPLNFWI